MIVLVYTCIVIASVIVLFIIELLVVALIPGFHVRKQHIEKTKQSLQNREATQTVKRKDVSFNVNGTPVSAWLYLPEDRSGQIPCIVMGQGLGGTKNMGLEFYAARFQQAGMAVLAFDYRYLGASGGEPRQLIWIPYQLEDWAAAIEYARSLKEIDQAKVGLWGTSLSGGHVMVTAAKDGRIACVAAQCPLLDGSAGGSEVVERVGIKYMLRMVGHAQRDLVRSWLRLSPHKIPIVGQPRTIALMADAEAWNAFGELAPDDFVNEACARIGIRMDKYKPINYMGKVKCPVLLQLCDNDISLPASVAHIAGKLLGDHAEVIHYPIGHFDIYLGDNFEKAVKDQVTFLKKHLDQDKSY